MRIKEKLLMKNKQNYKIVLWKKSKIKEKLNIVPFYLLGLRVSVGEFPTA